MAGEFVGDGAEVLAGGLQQRIPHAGGSAQRVSVGHHGSPRLVAAGGTRSHDAIAHHLAAVTALALALARWIPP
ncbi:hypothetical protein ACFFX0_10555 [Citricoccus parietis]|uniref:Uncharacterized protein n=1 Tax=Citricoccus parietis TaxID=592307 RepID=A0ABV5FY69_9MICC